MDLVGSILAWYLGYLLHPDEVNGGALLIRLDPDDVARADVVPAPVEVALDAEVVGLWRLDDQALLGETVIARGHEECGCRGVLGFLLNGHADVHIDSDVIEGGVNSQGDVVWFATGTFIPNHVPLPDASLWHWVVTNFFICAIVALFVTITDKGVADALRGAAATLEASCAASVAIFSIQSSIQGLDGVAAALGASRATVQLGSQVGQARRQPVEPQFLGVQTGTQALGQGYDAQQRGDQHGSPHPGRSGGCVATLDVAR